MTAGATVVVDASVALKVLVTEPGSAHALQLLQHEGWMAPTLVIAEIANVLRKLHRRGAVRLDASAQACAALPRFFEELVPLDGLAAQALDLAAELDHPAYDTFYLALALSRGLPLVTADSRLLSKTRGTRFEASVLDLQEAAALA